MDISAAGISLQQQAQLQQEVSTAVAKKSLDQARAQGDAAIQLLEQAVALGQGQPIKPGQLDVRA